MADTPVRPQFPAVNAPANTAAALSTLAVRIDDAIGVERALEQRDTPHLWNRHEASYEALHAALSDLSGTTALDGVSRLGADVSRQFAFGMLCEDARDQACLFDHSLRLLDLAIGCKASGFADPGIKASFRQIRSGLEALTGYHLVPMTAPGPENAAVI